MEKIATCNDIEMGIMQLFRREKRCCPLAPNLVIPHGWEADVAALTKTGFCHELEIKTSRSDFKADFRKSEYHKKHGTKHEQLASRVFEKGRWIPNYFWFCTPKGLLELSDIPDHAGLIEFEWRKYDYLKYLHLSATETKPAPRLHKNRTDSDHLKTEFLKRLTNIVAFGRGHNFNAVPKKIETKVAIEPQLSIFT